MYSLNIRKYYFLTQVCLMLSVSNWYYAVGYGTVALCTIYSYRYECAHQLCVWYTLCKRKWQGVTKQHGFLTNNTSPLQLDFTNGYASNNEPLKVKLFPHIKHIQCTPAITDPKAEQQLYKALNDWVVCYYPCHPEQKVTLYGALATRIKHLPKEIIVQLDKPLIDLLNITPLVQSSTADVSYVLTEDSVETLVLTE